MVNKLSIKTLGIVFLALLVIVAVFYIYDASRHESSFRTSLVSIDTANVTAIDIYPRSLNHKEVRLFKEGTTWKVNTAFNKTAVVPVSKVQELLLQLIEVKPLSVAAQSTDKWKEFNVDTTGTRVKVFEGSKNTLDLIIGKFSYQQPRSMNTYVRVENDDNVYLVSGFLDFSFNHDANYFRDDNVLNDDHINWAKLTFNYPADSSFQLVKANGRWEVDGMEIDSSKVENYLSSISRYSIPNFIDNPPQSLLNKAKYVVSIQSYTVGTINIEAYEDSAYLVITSSQHPGTYFDGKKADAWKRLFVGKSSLFDKQK